MKMIMLLAVALSSLAIVNPALACSPPAFTSIANNDTDALISALQSPEYKEALAELVEASPGLGVLGVVFGESKNTVVAALSDGCTISVVTSYISSMIPGMCPMKSLETVIECSTTSK